MTNLHDIEQAKYTADQDASRSAFEQAVIARLMESGFLEIEIRVECLVRCGDGYQDEIINAGWHYWNEGTKAAIRALSAEPAQGEQWQPIETAPKDWSDVVLFDPNLLIDHRKVCEGYYDTEFNEWHSPAAGVISPTHWMPLPAAPTSEAGR